MSCFSTGGWRGRMGGMVSLPVVILISVLIVVMYGSRLIRRRNRRRQRQAEAGPKRCKCGYPIENLALPRCPECGRVFGFDATAEEMGLTQDEMVRIEAARRRRQAAGGGQPPR